MIRTFIAVDISDKVRSGLGRLIDNLKKGVKFTPARPSWVRPESIHLTLKFLGNIEEEKAGSIGEALRKIAGETKPFTLRIRDLGVFPSQRRPRVLWCGVTKGEKQICHLQKMVDRAMAGFGFEKERRPFHPHLTLARIKSPRGTGALMNIVAGQRSVLVGECLIDRLILFRSELHPSGARYTRLVEAPFPEQKDGETSQEPT